MKWSERWMWFWYDLLKILCEEYGICPYCGSDKVVETWEARHGKYMNYDKEWYESSYDQPDVEFWCEDCHEWWDYWESPMEDDTLRWHDWEHKGYMHGTKK